MGDEHDWYQETASKARGNLQHIYASTSRVLPSGWPHHGNGAPFATLLKPKAVARFMFICRHCTGCPLGAGARGKWCRRARPQTQLGKHCRPIKLLVINPCGLCQTVAPGDQCEYHRRLKRHGAMIDRRIPFKYEALRAPGQTEKRVV